MVAVIDPLPQAVSSRAMTNPANTIKEMRRISFSFINQVVAMVIHVHGLLDSREHCATAEMTNADDIKVSHQALTPLMISLPTLFHAS